MTVLWRHSLKSVEQSGGAITRLVFTVSGATKNDPSREVAVDINGRRIIAADGVWSRMRQCLLTLPPPPPSKGEAYVVPFKETVIPWGCKFRLLISKPGASALGLDPAYHYVYVVGGLYASTVEGDMWTLGITIKPHQDKAAILDSSEATEENKAFLVEYVRTRAPLAFPLLNDENVTAYFERRTYMGAVVKVSRLNYGEEVVLLGDAAHSVLPPVGEGFNSGAEDCELLLDTLREVGGAGHPFEEYNKRRLPDVHALNTLAVYRNHTNFLAPPPDRAAAIAANISATFLKNCGVYKAIIQDYSFGTLSGTPLPYRTIVSMWKWQEWSIYSVVRLIFWPIYTLYLVLTLPFWGFKWLTKNIRGVGGGGGSRCPPKVGTYSPIGTKAKLA